MYCGTICSVQIQTIKQGYLLKRSSNLRGDWKRRFFVLDSRGMLYYYRKQWGKPTVSFITLRTTYLGLHCPEVDGEGYSSHCLVWWVVLTSFYIVGVAFHQLEYYNL